MANNQNQKSLQPNQLLILTIQGANILAEYLSNQPYKEVKHLIDMIQEAPNMEQVLNNSQPAAPTGLENEASPKISEELPPNEAPLAKEVKLDPKNKDDKDGPKA